MIFEIVTSVIGITFIAIGFAVYNSKQPKYYRVVRDPKRYNWHIEISQGFWSSTHKKYVGGGESGYPYFATKFFSTREQAEEEIELLLKKESDKGEKGPWIKK